MQDGQSEGYHLWLDIFLILIAMALFVAVGVGLWYAFSRYMERPGVKSGPAFPPPLPGPPGSGSEPDTPGGGPAGLLAPESLKGMKSFRIPEFRGNVPSVFNDVTWLERERKLMVANSVGMGQFPVKEGKPLFDPPGFVAACPGCGMRGFVQTSKVPTSALVWEKRLISVSAGGRRTVDFRLPDAVTDPTGIAHDGSHYLVADRKSNAVFRLLLDDRSRTANILDRLECPGKGVEGVTWYEDLLWVTDGKEIYACDETGGSVRRFRLDVHISGLAFAGAFLWATANGEPVMYRFDEPDPGP